MKTLFWALLLVAGLAFTGGLLLGSLPTRARPVITAAPPGTETVNCGTVFSDTEWSNDDGCEGPILNRAGLMMLAFMIALTAFIASAGVLVGTVRRGRGTKRCT
jgi:hypothetical protein